MPVRTVTGTIYHADGSAWASGTIKFNLLEPFETSTEVYPKETHSETLDANGAFSITLGVPDSGTASYLIETPDSKQYSVYIASGAATDLVTLLTIASAAVAQDAVQTLIDANNVLTITSTTAAYQVLASDDYIRVTSGSPTITLPVATGTGAVYICKNIGTGVITLDGSSNDTIDGDASVTIAAEDWYTVLDGAATIWWVI
jgi:hypothetical protein